MLERMIKIAQSEESSESESMAPDTNSFNIVLNALAQGKEKNSEFRAEELLEQLHSQYTAVSMNRFSSQRKLALHVPTSPSSRHDVYDIA